MSEASSLFMPDDVQGSGGFTGRDILRLLFKHRWTVIISLLLVSAISIYVAVKQPREFIASAQVQIRTEQEGAPSFLSGVAAYRETTVQDTPGRRLETEMVDLVNRSSVESVIKQLSLRPQDLKRPPLEVALEPYEPAISKAIDKLAVWLGFSLDPIAPDPLADAVKAFDRSISIDPIRSKGAEVTSNVIEIKLVGTDRERTQEALALLLKEYVERSSSRDTELGRQALQALQAQTAEAQARMTKAEEAIVEYSLRPRTSVANTRAPTALRAAPATEIKMRADEESLQAKLDVLRQTYGEEHPEVRAAKQALANLQDRAATQVRDSVRSDATIGVLERRRAVAETRYVELQRKLDQIDLYLKLSPTEVESRLITEPPRQAVKASVAPKLLGIIAGPVIGLLLGLALASLFELGDRRLQTRERAQNYLGLDTLASIPTLKNQRRLPESSQTILPPFPMAPPSIADNWTEEVRQ